METIVLLLVLASTFISWLLTLSDYDSNYKGFIGGCIGIIIPFITILLFIAYNKTSRNGANNPTAIDVYRGKTTLEITYKDNIPTDSVVVFK